MSDGPKTWYELVEATTAHLPWRTDESGVRVLGAEFPRLPRQVTKGVSQAVTPLPNIADLQTPGITTAPATAEQAYGTLVHAALQGLPLAALPAVKMQAEAEAAAVRAALPWLWAEGSRAEVALVLKNGEIGRADRLVPQGQVLWVIDFKTGTPQPTVPASYAAQLRGYAAALAASLPATEIRAAVVWTATATLAEVALSS